MAEGAVTPSLPRQRILPRFGRLVIVHVHVVSLLCYTAGVIAVLLLPLLAKNTYISENALMPGSGSPAFGSLDTMDARASAARVENLVSREQDVQRALRRWLLKQMGVHGADCYLHPFSRPSVSIGFSTLSQHFKWSSSNFSGGSHLEQHNDLAVNVVGIIRAPQGEGNEAIVLVTPLDLDHFGKEDALSLGIGLALFARLSKALWTARDIIWLVADARYGAYSAVAEWLKEYHEPSVSNLVVSVERNTDLVKDLLGEGKSFVGIAQDVTVGDFKRAGTIATGLIFELKTSPGETGDAVKLRAEGPNGQMPNLDLINIINSLAVWRENLSLQLESFPSLRNYAWLNYTGSLLVRLSYVVRKIVPSWDFYSGAAIYPKSLATLLSSMAFQVVGLPTGAHGAFREYQIDAVSLKLPFTAALSDTSVTKFGRLLEAVVRCVNNLLEKWHQSFFLYFLSAPHKYISVGVYMQPFALLLFSLPLTAAALCFPVDECGTTTNNTEDISIPAKDTSQKTNANKTCDMSKNVETLETDDSGTWLEALLLVSSVQIWAFVAALVLCLLSETSLNPEMKLSLWLVIVSISLKASLGLQPILMARISSVVSTARHGRTQVWMAVKVLTMGVTSIQLAVMSTVNYPVALLGALVLVPMCIAALPLQYTWKYCCQQGRSLLNVIPFGTGALVTVLGCPLSVVGLAKAFGGQFWGITPTTFWQAMEILLTHRSALLPYLLVMHLPCSVLCMCVFFSSHRWNTESRAS